MKCIYFFLGLQIFTLILFRKCSSQILGSEELAGDIESREEFSQNDRTVKKLFEGDIQLGDEERDALERDLDSYRSGSLGRHYRWENGVIPYAFSVKLTQSQKKALLSAMSRIGRVSCIKFVPRRREFDYVLFKHGESCSSAIGRQGGMQTVVLNPITCFQQGPILHELMHLMGFWHEQSRPDRDDYVEIKYDNIAYGQEQNFKKHLSNEDTFGIRYDYDSIMHFGDDYFQHDVGRKTLLPKRQLPKGVKLGQRDHLSKSDVEKINKLYTCLRSFYATSRTLFSGNSQSSSAFPDGVDLSAEDRAQYRNTNIYRQASPSYQYSGFQQSQRPSYYLNK